MNHKDILGWVGSIFGTGGTIYLGQITASHTPNFVSNFVSAFFTVACGTATLILTILKIVQWWHWWKNRNSTKPPTI